MMGYGYGRWGYYSRSPHRSLHLTVAQVKLYLENWIDMSGNPHLKAGPVIARDASTIIAEIVTKKRRTGGAVQREPQNGTLRADPFAVTASDAWRACTRRPEETGCPRSRRTG